MSLFRLFNDISWIVLVLYNVLQFKKKRLFLSGTSKTVMHYIDSKSLGGIGKLLSSANTWAILELLVVSAAQYLCVGFLNSGASKLFNTGANYFGVLYGAPILVVLLCLLIKTDPLAQLDLVTPSYPLALFFSKIACHFGGCCCGVPWEKGLYNPITRQIEFPAPFLEAGVALLLFVVLFAFRNRFKKGTIFPTYLISFSAIRFFTEFTRAEPDVFLGLKTYHFLCIAGVILGVIEYVLVCLYGKKQRRTSAMIEE